METAQTLVDTEIHWSPNLPATYDTSGYDAVTGFVEVLGVLNYDPSEGTGNVTVTRPIKQRLPNKYKGTRTLGTDTLTCERDDDDSGQSALLTGYTSDSAGSVKVTYQDGSIDYFTALVDGANTRAGDGDSVVQRIFTLNRVTETVTKAAA